MSRIGSALRVAGLILALTAPATAQPDAKYPNKPIRIVVSVPAGGGVDLSARIIANHLQTLWGQPVTVENRTGGSGNIAGEAVSRATPDGYTLLATPPNILTANSALFAKLNYDPSALTPVAIMAVGPNVLAVKTASPAKDRAELIAHAKANADKLSYASQGNGSTSHLTFELFKSRAGLQVTHVPYKGAAPAVNDLAGGHVDTMFCDIGTILSLHRADKVRIIAAATPKRIGAAARDPDHRRGRPAWLRLDDVLLADGAARNAARYPRAAQQGDRRRHAHARGRGQAEVDLRRSQRSRRRGNGSVHQGRGKAVGRRDPLGEDHRRSVAATAPRP